MAARVGVNARTASLDETLSKVGKTSDGGKEDKQRVTIVNIGSPLVQFITYWLLGQTLLSAQCVDLISPHSFVHVLAPWSAVILGTMCRSGTWRKQSSFLWLQLDISAGLNPTSSSER